MIIRGTPKNIDDYIKVKDIDGYDFNKNDFYPKYIDNEWLYFKKTKELLEFMERRDIKIERD